MKFLEPARFFQAAIRGMTGSVQAFRQARFVRAASRGLTGLVQVRAFLREEKGYAYLLVALLVFYGLFFAFSGPQDTTPSPAMTKIQKAEKHFEKQQSEKEFLMQVLTENPKAAVTLFLFVLAFFGALAAGFVLDLIVVTRALRKVPSIESLRPVEAVDWGPRDLVKVAILFMLSGLLFSLILGGLRKVLFHSWDDNFLILFHTTLTDLLLVVMIFYFVMRRHRQPLEALGLGIKKIGQNLMLGAAGYLATLPVFMFVLLILLGIAALFSYEPPPHPLVEVFVEEDKRNPFLINYSIFLACFFGPIIEEIFFRGFCYPALKKAWGMKFAMLATAGLFAWIHQSTFAFWPIFILGMILVYLYEKRGSLIPSITLHILHNSIFIAYFFMMKRVFLDKFL